MDFVGERPANIMASDPFDELLELENDYYKEGFDAGVADSEYAGMVEGRVFGIEKGYEKSLELGKLHGRTLVWQERFASSSKSDPVSAQHDSNHDISDPLEKGESMRLSRIIGGLGQTPDNVRLRRHIDGLHTATNSQTVARDNSDDSVTEFDDRVARARAKAKVIANISGESLNPTTNANAGIEDATGLQARH